MTESTTRKTAKPARDELAERMLHTLRSRLRAARTLAEREESALAALVRSARRAGADSIDVTLAPRGLFVSLGPVPEAGPSSIELTPTLLAKLRAAFETPVVRVDFAERPQLSHPIGEASALAESVALCRDWLARVRAMEDECVRDEDVEGVHELRIAVRRTRAALRWLERCARDPRVEQVVGVLRALGVAAGPVRDADVVHAMLRKRAPKGLARDAAMTAVQSAREARVHALAKHLRSRAYRAAMKGADDALASLLSAPALLSSDAARPVDERASRSMQRFFDRELRRIHERLEGDLTVDEGYHDVRRQLRRVRDIIDVCGPALGSRRVAWRSKLQPVQSVLGTFNDVVSAHALVKPAGEPVKEITGWLKGRRAAVLTELATPLAVLAVIVIAR
jgi:CHAD domain-containing protein